ncbi:G-protein-signaling modulator 2-like [Mya arenaria]|uniref:G-protein-signaling modulator 2-like n=1 Tax=Mya arenaria TaxID=6604 RepID=UPI0022E2076E|nr:G-protein-signaling modulator 2-like [Mya arenaria]XP_052789280.1 G-protein-signaling modulator 2-like [Mya arenaria]
MDCTCMELALEGERLCKAGDCRTGVQFFEAAVNSGTDDLKTLSAIYSQLGNAYFYLQEFGKALEYHKHDLNLARTLGDRVGEAKASGNLGNTLKVLGKFDEAIVCCLRHLDLSRELKDRIGEARALYNLGNVYHAKGKHTGRSGNQDPGEFPFEVKECLIKAAEYYEANLNIVQELGDRAAQGRACGNLGNTHYLLGNFSQAIIYHQERLAIAREFGDKAAERRAYSNLGNAHIFLGEFEVAAEHYRKTLQIAKQLCDKALEAQACYSLGNTYTLLKDYEKAIEYHMKHLKIAQELEDRVGEGRACWSLGNAHTALGLNEEAIKYASKHLEISKEIGDETGQVTAQMNLADLKSVLGIKAGPEGERPSPLDHLDVGMYRRAGISRRHSMEQMEIMKLAPDKKGDTTANHGGARPKIPKVQKSMTVASETIIPKSQSSMIETLSPEDDGFFDLLSKFQGRRIDEQRCSLTIPGEKNGISTSENKENEQTKAKMVSTTDSENFLDMVAGIQGSRMNDQRATLPQFPGLNSQTVINQYLRQRNVQDVPDDNFFEMLMRCQGSRIDDQRSALPHNRQAPTVPDEDFFSLIQKVQSSRLEEQRTILPDKEEEIPTKQSSIKKKKK